MSDPHLLGLEGMAELGLVENEGFFLWSVVQTMRILEFIYSHKVGLNFRGILELKYKDWFSSFAIAVTYHLQSFVVEKYYTVRVYLVFL